MRFFKIIYFCFLFSLSFGQNLNQEILDEANKYDRGGYFWDGTGVLEPLVFNDSIYLAKSDSGSFCSGFTLMLAFDVLKANDKLSKSILNNFFHFYRNWYGVPPESREKQCVYTIKKYNLGQEISLDQAVPGDLVQFWRNNNSGHSVVFLGWEKNEKNETIGMNYKSSQLQTHGIGLRCEFIGEFDEYINPKRIYICRLNK